MTRINLVDVKDLADQHLFSEYREIKMIPPALRRSIIATQKNMGRTQYHDDLASQVLLSNRIPETYTLNEGHVTFFYDKMSFLKERYELLQNELLTRNFAISHLGDYTEFTHDLHECWHNDYKPTSTETQVNIDRIVQRLNEKPTFYRYHGDVVPPSFFEDRYKHQTLVDVLS